jgi:hypothetical protein
MGSAQVRGEACPTGGARVFPTFAPLGGRGPTRARSRPLARPQPGVTDVGPGSLGSEASGGEQVGTRLVALGRPVRERPRVKPEGGLLFATEIGGRDDLLLNPLERIAALHHHRDAFLEPDDAVHLPSYALQNRFARSRPAGGPPRELVPYTDRAALSPGG